MAIMMLLFIFICMLSLLGCSCTTTITAKAFDHITRGTCVSQVGGSNGEAEFRFNLKNLLSTTLSSNADHGYHNATYVGTNSAEKVYVSFLCRGDVTSDICKECVDTATTFAFQNCPHATDAVLWFDKCLYRISNDYAWIHPMANNSRRDYVKVLTGKNVITKPISRYNRLLAATMNKLVTEAAKADRLFTTKEAQVKGSNMTLYSLAQCTPTADCNQCLRAAVADIVSREDQLEGFFLYQNCNIRYQLSPFFKKLKTVAAGSRSKLILYIVAVVLALIVCACVVHVALGAYDIVRRRELETHVNTARQQENDGYIELLHFNLRTIQIATSNFSEDNKLGEGGFGEVFQGTLGNGTEIAVKKLSKSSKQGVKEFKNEVALVAKLQHRNLVRQLGFCLEGEEAILVYE